MSFGKLLWKTDDTTFISYRNLLVHEFYNVHDRPNLFVELLTIFEQ